MAEVIGNSFWDAVGEAYNSFVAIFPSGVGQGINVFVIAVAISLITLFIWYFYRTLSQKNLISLNLAQYNKVEHQGMSKFLAVVLYMLEYIVIMPFLILIWFTALSIFILVIAPQRTVSQVLTVTAAMVLSIRILAYGNTEISKDLAKLFPFITLSVFISTPGSFAIDEIILKISGIPLLLVNIFYFILVILIIEILLRVVYTARKIVKNNEPAGEIVAIRRKVKAD